MVKTRLQNSNKGEYRGLMDCFKRIIRQEGSKGLYRGQFVYFSIKIKEIFF